MKNNKNVGKKKKANQRHYEANKDAYRIRAKAAKARAKAYIASVKTKSSCIRCDEKDLSCLEFHHRDPSQKELCIALAPEAGWAIPRIAKEIEKCDVLCANCHRKFHASGW